MDAAHGDFYTCISRSHVFHMGLICCLCVVLVQAATGCSRVCAHGEEGAGLRSVTSPRVFVEPVLLLLLLLASPARGSQQSRGLPLVSQ